MPIEYIDREKESTLYVNFLDFFEYFGCLPVRPLFLSSKSPFIGLSRNPPGQVVIGTEFQPSCRHPQRRVVGPEGDTQEEQVNRIIYRDEDRTGAFLVRLLFRRCVYFLHTGHGEFFPVSALLKSEEFNLHKILFSDIIVTRF